MTVNRPSTTVSFDGIPAVLQSIPNWVVWRPVPVLGTVKPAKRLFRAEATMYPASSTNRFSWAEFAVAREAVERLAWTHGSVGIGFVLSDLGIVFVDLDHVLSPHGQLDSEAEEIVRRLDSYTEVSPGGDGLHILVAARLPFEGRQVAMSATGGLEGRKIEAYQTGRYLTMTGHLFRNSPTTIESRQEALNWLVEHWLKSAPTKITRGEITARPVTTSDAKLLALIRKRKAWFRLLYDNGIDSIERTPSQTDCAMLNELAWWTGYDDERMARLFLASEWAAIRPNDGKLDRPDYLPKSIDNAITYTFDCSGGTSYFSCDVPEGGSWASEI